MSHGRIRSVQNRGTVPRLSANMERGKLDTKEGGQEVTADSGDEMERGVHLAPCSLVFLGHFHTWSDYRGVQSKCTSYTHTKHVHTYRLLRVHFQTNLV